MSTHENTFVSNQTLDQNPEIQLNDELYSYLFAVRISFQDIYESESDIIRELKKHLLDIGTEQSQLNTVLHNFYSQFGSNIPIETIQEVELNNNSIVNNMLGFLLNELDYDITDENINQPHLEQQNVEVDDNSDSNDESSNDEVSNDENSNEVHTHNNLTNFLNSVMTMVGQAGNIQIIQPNYQNIVVTVDNNPIGQAGNIQIIQPNYQNVVVTVDENELENIESKQLVSNSDINCSVCMGQMIKEEFVSELKCAHIFHTDCIKPYLSQYNYKCPNCRSEVGKPKYNM
jgi:hypothetical protein